MSKLSPGRRLSLGHLIDMQKVLYSTTMDGTTKPMERASCARSWEVLEERKRILRGKLKAGSFNAHQADKPDNRRPKRPEVTTMEQVAEQMRAKF